MAVTDGVMIEKQVGSDHCIIMQCPEQDCSGYRQLLGEGVSRKSSDAADMKFCAQGVVESGPFVDKADWFPLDVNTNVLKCPAYVSAMMFRNDRVRRFGKIGNEMFLERDNHIETAVQ